VQDPDRGRGRVEQRIGDLLGGDQRPRLHVLDREAQPFRWVRRVQRHIGRPGLQHAQDGHDELG
jgi:hypothetical protein